VLALGGETPGEEQSDAEALGMAKVIAIAAHEGALTHVADVVIPATSWAEQSGTYVNAKGMRQLAEKALEPQGASRPAWEHLAALAKALGVEPSWTKVKQLRAMLPQGDVTQAGAV
jgi:NADH-quinone oxidoreductase subunit G